MEDAALSLEVLAGRDDRDMTSATCPVEKYSELLNGDISGKKIGIIKNVQDALNNEKVKEAFNDLIKN